MPDATIILVHGLWLPGLEMKLLRKRLARAGYTCRQFTYHSVRSTPLENARDLQAFANAHKAATVHYVCHSLGGLVTRHFFHEYPKQPAGRIVTLGTPHSTSSLAEKLIKVAPGRASLGKSVNKGLLGNVPAWHNEHELGVIAGTLSMGMGRLIPGLPKPNDGTVTVEETKLEGMTDHMTLPVSHFGVLISPQVAEQTIYFLEHGVFKAGNRV